MFGLHAGWARSCCVLLFVAWMGRKASSKLLSISSYTQQFSFRHFSPHFSLSPRTNHVCYLSRSTSHMHVVVSARKTRSHARELTTTTSRSFTSNPIQLQQFSMNTRRFWYVMLCVGEEEKKKDLRALNIGFSISNSFFFTQAERRTTS